MPSRRQFVKSALLAAVPAAWAASPVRTRGEVVQFLDPVTETPVFRLTSPAYTSFLPTPPHRFLSSDGKFLIYSSDRGGHGFALHRLDLKTGITYAVVQPQKLDPKSFSLDIAGKALLYLDGGSLKEFSLGSRRVRTVVEGEVRSFSLGRSGTSVVWVREGKLENEKGVKLANNVQGQCFLSPDLARCAYTEPSGPGLVNIWDVPFGTESDRSAPKLLVQNSFSQPFWSPDDPALLFLRRETLDGIDRSSIHEVFVAQAAEQTVSPTPAFASFSPNANASVFVGASRSKAQPQVVLLLRSPRRELTLCEHRCSDAQAVAPVFSPDSRHVFFQSDKEGKFAIYAVNTEKLVEPT